MAKPEIDKLVRLKELANQCLTALAGPGGSKQRDEHCINVLVQFALHIEKNVIENMTWDRYTPPEKSGVTNQRLLEIQKRDSGSMVMSHGALEEMDLLRQERHDLLIALGDAIKRIEYEETWSAIAFQDNSGYQEGKNAAYGELLLSLERIWVEYKSRESEDTARGVNEARKLVEQRLENKPMPPHERTIWKANEAVQFLRDLAVSLHSTPFHVFITKVKDFLDRLER